MKNLNIKNYKGNELNKIKLIKDINLGDYKLLNEDYNNELPLYVDNINGNAIIKKGNELYYGNNPFNGADIIMDDNENSLDIYLDENDYIILK